MLALLRMLGIVTRIDLVMPIRYNDEYRYISKPNEINEMMHMIVSLILFIKVSHFIVNRNDIWKYIQIASQ